MPNGSFNWNHETLSQLIRNQAFPCMMVDLDCMEKNIQNFVAAQKRIRLATKSIRVPELLSQILQKGSPTFSGLMAYSLPEAVYLVEQGFDDILVAYPSASEEEIDAALSWTEKGKKIVMTVDSLAHLQCIQAAAKKRNFKLAPKVCIDIDVSYRPLGGMVHLGVQRSPLRHPEAVRQLIQHAKSMAIDIVGVLAYEAQIAGMTDSSPHQPWMNFPKKCIKKLSERDVLAKRKAVADVLAEEGISLEFFNGGGSGSLASTCQDPVVTEIGAGSGILQSQLFDYYQQNQNSPALFFGLQITRQPAPGVVTCQSGGFIASGEISPDKAPTPFLPPGLKTFPHECFGEVQTPLKVPAHLDLKVGDPVFFRPAKAGEIAERFDHYILLKGGEIVGSAKTYRGLGRTFF